MSPPALRGTLTTANEFLLTAGCLLALFVDYSLSHDWGCSVEGRYAMKMALPERVRDHVDQEVLDDWCEAPETVLQDLLAQLRKEYGSVEGYLDSIGVDEPLRRKLRGELTAVA